MFYVAFYASKGLRQGYAPSHEAARETERRAETVSPDWIVTITPDLRAGVAKMKRRGWRGSREQFARELNAPLKRG